MSGRRLLTVSDALSFMQAGNATVTIVSRKTGTRFTYRIRESDDGKLFFVSLLNGADNNNSYVYLGIIMKAKYRRTNGSKVTQDAPSHLAFDWTYNQNLAEGKLPDTLEIWHEGRCGRCNRLLTVPESIASGIGPECARHARRSTPQLCLAV